jgi:hypothetical protein
MNMPGFTAEASLAPSTGEYGEAVGFGRRAIRTEEGVVPQLRCPVGCFPVSPHVQVCGCEDETTKTSHWVILPI